MLRLGLAPAVTRLDSLIPPGQARSEDRSGEGVLLVACSCHSARTSRTEAKTDARETRVNLLKSTPFEPSSAEVLAWQGVSRSPAFPCKSGTPMVLSVPGERLFVRDAFLNDHWIREPCLVCPQVSLKNYQGRILSAFIEGIHFPFNQGTPIWQSPPRNVRQNRQNPIRPVTSASQLG
ncbi:hypothetical protein CA85_18290 [Allorhodopirellula solitaria]|uniref:Uncharacterized protein n=1 Tax=Allorhodopirellula solitaria TaxID=2527987 RepID=A0A5C5YDC0_9BACT|nr:hypothetical protein CA85_18290 [Allorhodopirellula solitaria]